MKQIIQYLANGDTKLADVPAPECGIGKLLIQSRNSIISAGTERMLIDFGKANVLDKARQQPDKVRMVLDKVRTDGLLPTIEAVRSKLDQPLPLGYCNAGVILESLAEGFAAGDRVVSNGPHAEIVSVASNLCAKIPDTVDDETAAFAVLGAIALQGVRLTSPTIGESVVVVGLGLIGLLCVQILRANGCRVLGIDFDETKCRLAQEFGAETVNLTEVDDPLAAARVFSRGRGVDAVVVAAATKSNRPMSQAANMCRKRGRIVLVGVVGLELTRAEFYEKELTFQVSCSYGPGRYDPSYEGRGNDYPVGFVRWTEQRNFEAVLDMMADGALDIAPLITHRYAFHRALDAYKELDNNKALGIVLEYPVAEETSIVRTVPIAPDSKSTGSKSDVVCAFIGAGSYASRILLPAFRSAGAEMDTIVSAGGISAVHQGKKYGFRTATTEIEAVLESEKINTVVIATKHDLHATQVVSALRSGKHVFVEKPLAITLEELDTISEAYSQAASRGQRLMVGYNRRFAPQIDKMKELISQRQGPKSIIITVNAGEVPADHWTQDPSIGGGRIIGEGCHFFDLLRFLIGKESVKFVATQVGDAPGIGVRDDKSTVSITFKDGSVGTVHYLANGSKSFPKERIEVFCDGAVLQLDNFKKMRGYGWPGFSKMNLSRQDKGQRQCVAQFVNSINTGQSAPVPAKEIFEVARLTINIANSLQH